MFNSFNPEDRSPFGAVAAGTPVRFRIRLPKNDPRTPVLRLFEAGSAEPWLSVPTVREEGGNGEWNYRATCIPDRPGLFFYTFLLAGEGGEPTPLHRRADGSAGPGEGPCWQLTVYAKDFTTPKPFRGRTMMQIFPDRFSRSGRPHENVPEDRILHRSFDEEPKSVTDPDGVFRSNDYFGGDLEGIRRKLDYIQDMGVETLYLNPIFEAHSNHRYNTADYFKIDPLLGSEEDFVRLAEDLHRRGMLLILDGVFNHTGSDSRYFNREGRYGKGGAYRDPGSPFRDWYLWNDYDRKIYQCWWGFESLPNLNEGSPEFREFVCGENGVLRYWIRRGADGWRLDVTDELTDSFVRDIRAAVKAENKNALLLGEVWEDASRKQSYGEQRQYLMGRELDSVTNYPFRSAVLGFLRDGDGPSLRDALWELMENYPAEVTAVCMNPLSGHDVSRAITALGGLPLEGHDRDWQRAHNRLSEDQYRRGRQLLMLGTLMQFSWPGCPCLYYGDEAGLCGYEDPFNRAPYPWGREDEGLRECIRQIAVLRQTHPVLRDGTVTPGIFQRDFASWIRKNGEEELVLAVNRGRAPFSVPRELSGTAIFAVGGWDGHVLQGESAVLIRRENAS